MTPTPPDNREAIRAAVALLPHFKKELEAQGDVFLGSGAAKTIIAALEAISGDGVVDRNAVLEEAARFIEGFDTNYTLKTFGKPYVNKTEIVASIRALASAHGDEGVK